MQNKHNSRVLKEAALLQTFIERLKPTMTFTTIIFKLTLIFRFKSYHE